VEKCDPFNDIGYSSGRQLRGPSRILGPERLRVVEETVRQYYRSGRPWDQFASRLDPGTRRTVSDGLRELRAHGWLGPVHRSGEDILYVKTSS
jgi:hypothetical protein